MRTLGWTSLAWVRFHGRYRLPFRAAHFLEGADSRMSIEEGLLMCIKLHLLPQCIYRNPEEYTKLLQEKLCGMCCFPREVVYSDDFKRRVFEWVNLRYVADESRRRKAMLEVARDWCKDGFNLVKTDWQTCFDKHDAWHVEMMTNAIRKGSTDLLYVDNDIFWVAENEGHDEKVAEIKDDILVLGFSDAEFEAVHGEVSDMVWDANQSDPIGDAISNTTVTMRYVLEGWEALYGKFYVAPPASKADERATHIAKLLNCRVDDYSSLLGMCEMMEYFEASDLVVFWQCPLREAIEFGKKAKESGTIRLSGRCMIGLHDQHNGSVDFQPIEAFRRFDYKPENLSVDGYGGHSADEICGLISNWCEGCSAPIAEGGAL